MPLLLTLYFYNIYSYIPFITTNTSVITLSIMVIFFCNYVSLFWYCNFFCRYLLAMFLIDDIALNYFGLILLLLLLLF